MAMPGAIARPRIACSLVLRAGALRGASWPRSAARSGDLSDALSGPLALSPSGASAFSFFMKTGLDQAGHRLERLLGVPALGFDLDRAALAGAQHHQPHDGAGRDLLAFAGDMQAGGEAF